MNVLGTQRSACQIEQLHEAMGMRQVALLPQIGWKFDRWHDVGYWMVQFGENDARPRTVRAVREAWADIADCRE